jgi:hypothetical protein
MVSQRRRALMGKVGVRVGCWGDSFVEGVPFASDGSRSVSSQTEEFGLFVRFRFGLGSW